jgi:hypothetical protein
MLCKAFEKDGFCRFGDSCKNSHVGFTCCDLCGLEVEDLTEEVTLVQEEKKKEKVKEKPKGPVNVFAFLDDSSSSDSNSDSEEESDKEEEEDNEEVVEKALASATLSPPEGGDDDFQQVDVKATRQAAVKVRVIQSALCCRGGRIDVRTSHQSKESVAEFVKNAPEWKVGEIGGEDWSLPEGMEDILKVTAKSEAVEVAVLSLLHNMTVDAISENTVEGYATKPWSVCASDMKDRKTMLECFSLQSNVSHGSAGTGPAAVGNIFHSILEDAADSSEGIAKLGADWSSANSSPISVTSLGLKVHGCSDAIYQDMPVELKTISSLKMLKDAQKVRGWLNQVAIYQCERTSAAILLVIGRDSFELKAFEVDVSNIDQAVTLWQEIFQNDSFLKDLMDRSNDYQKEVDSWKECRFTQSTPNRAFLQLMSDVPQLFGNEIFALSKACGDALQRGEYRESCQYYKDARRLNMRNKKQKNRLFDGEESIKEMYDALDVDMQLKAEELYQQMVAVCPLKGDFSSFEVDTLLEAVELGRLSSELYEALLGMQNTVVPPIRAHIVKLKMVVKSKKDADEDKEEEEGDREGKGEITAKGDNKGNAKK